VLSAVPVYQPFLSAPRNSRRTLRTVELVLRDGRWTFDFDALAKAISRRTRLFLLCSPHNPVGRLFTRDELTTLAGICERHEVFICSDEIHCDLILDEDKKQIPTATLSREAADRTITLLAPSKTFNVPGLGCSFAVIPNRSLRERFRAAMAGIVPDVNAMGFTAALAAYREGGEWLQAVLAYLRKNRDAVARAVAAMPGLSMTHVEATYLAWIDTREAGIKDAATFFLDAGVGLSEGKEFGGPGFIRLNFACPRSRLTTALERMGRAMARTGRRAGETPPYGFPADDCGVSQGRSLPVRQAGPYRPKSKLRNADAIRFDPLFDEILAQSQPRPVGVAPSFFRWEGGPNLLP
jgi:cystathionine beta-lyase